MGIGRATEMETSESTNEKKLLPPLINELLWEYFNTTSQRNTYYSSRFMKETVIPKNPFQFLRGVDLDDVKVVIIIPDVYYPFLPQPLAKKRFDESLYYPILSNMLDSLTTVTYEKEFVVLNNVFDETLETWLSQGVLILPQSFTKDTSREDDVDSKKWWRPVIKRIVMALDQKYKDLIFLFWGDARELDEVIVRNTVITSEDSKVSDAFDKVNDILYQKGDSIIYWLDLELLEEKYHSRSIIQSLNKNFVYAYGDINLKKEEPNKDFDKLPFDI